MPPWVAGLSERLDVFLSRQCEGLTRSRAQKEIKAGAVYVNDKRVLKPSLLLRAGDAVSMRESKVPVPREDLSPIEVALPILFENDECLVLLKPAGFAVHPGAGTGDRATILHGIAHLFQKKRLPFDPSSVLVHRLDKDTTGCLLVAKTPSAHAELQRQFRLRSVEKTYLALVAGVPKEIEALIDSPLGRDVYQRTKMSVLGTAKMRSAKTFYRVLCAAKDCALLSCDLLTGRTHQIRVHLSSIGHPLLGDKTYGTKQSQKMSERYGIERICLHAWKLAFRSKGETVQVEAPLPLLFASALHACGLQFAHSVENDQ